MPKYLDANGEPVLDVPLNSYSELSKYNDVAEFFRCLYRNKRI